MYIVGEIPDAQAMKQPIASCYRQGVDSTKNQ